MTRHVSGVRRSRCRLGVRVRRPLNGRVNAKAIARYRSTNCAVSRSTGGLPDSTPSEEAFCRTPSTELFYTCPKPAALDADRHHHNSGTAWRPQTRVLFRAPAARASRRAPTQWMTRISTCIGPLSLCAHALKSFSASTERLFRKISCLGLCSHTSLIRPDFPRWL
jgi:hypothetical protein